MSKVFTIAEGLENMGALRTGGQGSVYKGRRTGFIYSAIKLIPTPIYAEDTADDKNYRNFQNEVAKLQKVNEVPNPNIVKILGWGLSESGSFPFIEMEYIDGPDLGELLHAPNDKIFTIKELLKVADQLACALAHCHKHGVKHGDIKSNNIKYNIHSGNYVLLDFGLAIMTEEQRRSSMRTAGAVEFMAPEQYDGKMLLQTDIYSFGIILYELMAGEVPFPLDGEGENGRNTVMLQHMNAEIPDLLEKRKGNLPAGWSDEQKDREMKVPAWLVKLVYKCLQKNPEGRYPNGDALYKALALHQTQFGSTLPVDLSATRNISPTAAVTTNQNPEPSKIQISKFVFWGLFLSFIILLAVMVFAVLLYKHNTLALKIYSHSLTIIKSVFGKSQLPLKR